jgi:hypothetical protein
MPGFPSLRAFGAMICLVHLLSGCSVNGNYPDATEPDAAKLRFISDLDSATLGIFDAEHCGGQTTGILNNLFMANTSRRAGMKIVPPADTKAYLEIRLSPGSDLFLHVNTQNTSSVCGNAFNLTPQSDAEYELTFDFTGRMCRLSLTRLHQVGDKIARSPIPLVNKGLPTCAGSNAMFPKLPELQPDNAGRTAMIEDIIADSLTEQMKVKPGTDEQPLIGEALHKQVEERKQRMGFTLPEAYWSEYQRNMDTFAAEFASRKARALQLYEDVYRTRLRQLDTTELMKLLPDSDSTDMSLALSFNNKMLQYYHAVSQEVFKENLNNHLARMAELDRRFSVCERFVDCWQN